MGRRIKKKHTKSTSEKKTKSSSANKGIVRVAGVDVSGDRSIRWVLMRVKGFNHRMSVVVSKYIYDKFNVEPNTHVGDIPEKRLEEINSMLYDISSIKGIPDWMFNRRRDPTSGKNMHVIMNDLDYYNREDVEREKKLYTWRGYRHAYGQKVRGQKTKNTGRRGMTVGVIRKSQQPGQQPKKADNKGSSKGGKK